jgi:hypothetical protein
MKPDFLLKVRPAPLASLLAAAFRLNKRRLVFGKHATLFIDQVSAFGAAILKGQYEPRCEGFCADTYRRAATSSTWEQMKVIFLF